MAKPKHHPNAEALITDYINALPPFSKEICVTLRAIILATDKSIVEDWKWGPNYYCHGMVCGFGAFQKHVSFVFFQGALLKDEKKLLIANPGNIHNRHLRFTNCKEIKPSIIKSFLKEAIRNNQEGKLVTNDDKTIEIPTDLRMYLSKNKKLKNFESLTYYKRKEMINWLMAAKREETKLKRLDKIIEMVTNNTFFY
ncbi:MAG: DUF1801 domain-containing protein [Bacteroidota bacterium]